MTLDKIPPIPLPASFRATIVRSDGDVSKVWLDGSKRRVELTAKNHPSTATIFRPDLGVMYSVNTDEETFVEYPVGASEIGVINANIEDGEVWQHVGNSEIDGNSVDKYESWAVDSKSNYPRQLVFVDRETKMRRRVVTINKLGNPVLTIDYRDIVLGPQPPEVFEVPKGFTKTRS